jgi:hypothetical protein
VDADGNLLITEVGGHRIRKVTHDGIIRTIAGTGVKGFSGEGGPALQAQVNAPHNVIADAQGNLYFPDTNNRRIRALAPVAGSVLASERPLAAAQEPRITVQSQDGTIFIQSLEPHNTGASTGGRAAPAAREASEQVARS